jgi:hypothetical protein
MFVVVVENRRDSACPPGVRQANNDEAAKNGDETVYGLTETGQGAGEQASGAAAKDCRHHVPDATIAGNQAVRARPGINPQY